MGWNNSNSNCFTQSSEDIYTHFNRKITLGELKALHIAKTLSSKVGLNGLQLEYQKLIEKKMGINSMSIKLPANELTSFFESLQKSNSFEKSGIMLQAQFENPYTPHDQFSKGDSHIFTIKFDKNTKDLVHQNSDQTISNYNTADFEKWSKIYDSHVIRMLSNRHGFEDFAKIFIRHALVNNMSTNEPHAWNNSRHRSAFSPLLAEFLKRTK